MPAGDPTPLPDGSNLLDDSGAPLPGAPMGMLLTAQARRRPDAPAFTFNGRSWTFAEMERATNRLAHHLAARGVVAGDRVVVSAPNRPDYAQAIFALWKLGATPCPLSHRLTPTEFLESIALAEPRLVIGTAMTPRSLVSGVGTLDLDDPALAQGAEMPLPLAVSTPGKILASGGSTGRPKLIVDPIASVWGPDKASSYRPPSSTILNAGPLYHAAPFAYAIVALAEGSHIVCMERFDPVGWLTLAERHRATAATLVPTMMSRIAKLDDPLALGADLSAFRFAMHSSAPCPVDVKRWWLERLPPSALWEVYGGTERMGATLINGEEWLSHPGSVGRPIAGDSIVILDAQGQPLPAGEIGEIMFRRAGGVGKYYRYIGAESRIRDDLDGMGDMGWVDDQGYLYIADRRTDMILVGGVNVYPAEVEAAIERLPQVLCAAVIGLPDPDLGNRVHAIVELAQGTDTPSPEHGLQILAPALERLAPFKRPLSVEFTYERVRDDAGKVRRSALRDQRINAQTATP